MNFRNTLIGLAVFAALITGVWFFSGNNEASAQRGHMGSGNGQHMMGPGQGGMMGPGGYGMMGRGGMMGPGMGMMMGGGSPSAMALHMEMRMHGPDARDTVIGHARRMLSSGRQGWDGLKVPSRNELSTMYDRMQNYSNAWNRMHQWMWDNHDMQSGYRDDQRMRDGSGRGMGRGMQQSR